MRRSIRYQIVGLVGAMLIASLATYLFLANNIVASEKLQTLQGMTGALAAPAAGQVDESVESLADKLRTFARLRPEPGTLFDDDDGVYSLRIFERDDTSWHESFAWSGPKAPAAAAQ